MVGGTSVEPYLEVGTILGFMEIDLNHAVTEVEKHAFCNGDCDKASCVCCLSSSSSSSSASNSSVSPDPSSIYLELWHVCAGPLTSLPKKGNAVVYFPQGHLEQAASSSPFPPMDISTFDLPPQIFCRVVNVQLLVSTELVPLSPNCLCFFFLLNSPILLPTLLPLCSPIEFAFETG